MRTNTTTHKKMKCIAALLFFSSFVFNVQGAPTAEHQYDHQIAKRSPFFPTLPGGGTGAAHTGTSTNSEDHSSDNSGFIPALAYEGILNKILQDGNVNALNGFTVVGNAGDTATDNSEDNDRVEVKKTEANVNNVNPHVISQTTAPTCCGGTTCPCAQCTNPTVVAVPAASGSGCPGSGNCPSSTGGDCQSGGCPNGSGGSRR